MERYVIPRNIRVREAVAYGMTGKQVIYLGIGVGASACIWAITGIPFIGIIEKAFGTIVCAAGALSLSLAKAHGQELDAYIVRSIKYPLRAKEFGGEQHEEAKVVCHIRYNLQ